MTYKLNFIGVLTLFFSLAGCTALETNQAYNHIHQGLLPITAGKIFYQSIGDSQDSSPIVIVHGGPGLDQTYLQPQLYKLSEHNTVIFYDQRGSGQSMPSTIDSKNINIKQFVSDIEQLRIRLGLKKIILMGHSWGGLLSMHYAIKYPQNLKGLILLNTAPADFEGQKAFVDNFINRTKIIHSEIQPLFSYEEFKKQDARTISDLYRKVFSAYFYKPENVNQLTLNFNINSARSGFKVNQELSKTAWLTPGINLFPALETLDIPTLVVHGRQDIVPVWTAEKISAAIKHSKIIILEKCGHFPYIEKPQEFNHALSAFIARLEKKHP